MPSNEERRAAALKKLEQQNEQRAAAARKRKVLGISAGAAVVVVLVAAGCYLWLPQGPRGPLRFAAENRYKTLHTQCDYADQKDQVAALQQNIAQGKEQTAKLPAAQKTEADRQIKRLEDAVPKLQAQAAFVKGLKKPSGKDVPNTGDVSGELTTNFGALPFTLDRSWAPCNVESFASLISQKYFDGTQCFRETAADAAAGANVSVLQCGDRSNTALGGASWTAPDETPTQLKAAPNAQAQMGSAPTVIYPAGTIAMAKSSAPNSASSQFFLVYADTQLPASYSTIGKLSDSGLKTLKSITDKGIDPSPYDAPPAAGAKVSDGVPKETVTVSGAKLS
ncbi:peptidylprolyl isomerase [Tsukamurella sp. 8F]|uniref:peptidylprolyl isomerase n=1 Tax=unclassified Tsukamurella TaxID=2633480 RepID=UPI0023BA18FB|nr:MULTISPECIES: peptidylprolyl isomerase [unclassified Tsukamurella]MDF0529154.1 peptidylprolyl isomerase [Tsukamurella sp. 8J]MDF0585339.1 peptidylprolyl isomerase [Tsukamurella sp. 8F]